MATRASAVFYSQIHRGSLPILRLAPGRSVFIAGSPYCLFDASNSCDPTEIFTCCFAYYLLTTSMPTADPAIHLDHVSRHYTMGETHVRAVDDLSLSVPSGEFLALLGSSGSGKSTLLNLIAGLDRPTAGAIVAYGQNIASLSSLDLARYRRNTIGMIFQSFNLLARMTLQENVELPLRLAEVDRSDRGPRVREALERVRLTHRVGHRPTELSGGEQQRVAIARALVNRPKILLADEPTGNLDSNTGEAILSLLRDLRNNLGMTIVMVTHERPLAERFADRLAIMGDGKLLSAAAAVKGIAQ
jgi:putative ABC transport system ATP-binding protein